MLNFGKAVAHYKRGQLEKPEMVLKEAAGILPNAAKELLKKKHKDVSASMPDSVSVGGKEEAYDFPVPASLRWLHPFLYSLSNSGFGNKFDAG